MPHTALPNSIYLSLILAAGALAADPIRASWNSPNPFAEPPNFAMETVQQPGTVIVHVQLGKGGSVASAKVVSGDGVLRTVVERSFRGWRFSKAQPADFPVYVYFKKDDGTEKGGAPLPPPPPYGATIGGVDISGLPEDVRVRVAKAVGVKAGDVFTEQVMTGLRKTVKEFHPPIRFWVSLGAYARPVIYVRPK